MTRALLLLPAFMLGGCITLLPPQPAPPRLFVLEAGEVARAEGEPIDAVIAVAAPDGERTLLGADLVWRTGDQIAFVAQSQWSGRSEETLQAVLVETLDGKWQPALCYICPEMEPHPAANDYIDRIAGPAREYGFPAWYIQRLESFRP